VGRQLRKVPDWERVASAMVGCFVVPWVLVWLADLVMGQIGSESEVKMGLFVSLGLAAVAAIAIAARIIVDSRKAAKP